MRGYGEAPTALRPGGRQGGLRRSGKTESVLRVQAGCRRAGMDGAAVVAVIQALATADFEKSMTSHADPRLWQDVSRRKVADSFKEA